MGSSCCARPGRRSFGPARMSGTQANPRTHPGLESDRFAPKLPPPAAPADISRARQGKISAPRVDAPAVALARGLGPASVERPASSGQLPAARWAGLAAMAGREGSPLPPSPLAQRSHRSAVRPTAARTGPSKWGRTLAGMGVPLGVPLGEIHARPHLALPEDLGRIIAKGPAGDSIDSSRAHTMQPAPALAHHITLLSTAPAWPWRTRAANAVLRAAPSKQQAASSKQQPPCAGPQSSRRLRQQPKSPHVSPKSPLADRPGKSPFMRPRADICRIRAPHPLPDFRVLESAGGEGLRSGWRDERGRRTLPRPILITAQPSNVASGEQQRSRSEVSRNLLEIPSDSTSPLPAPRMSARTLPAACADIRWTAAARAPPGMRRNQATLLPHGGALSHRYSLPARSRRAGATIHW